MNLSMCDGDATTHLKIVATTLLASVLVVWMGIATHVSSSPTATLAPGKPGPSMLAAVDGGRI